MHGKGILKDVDGFHFQGDFQDNHINGYCITKYRDEIITAFHCDDIPYGFVRQKSRNMLVKEGYIQGGEFKIGKVLLLHANRIYEGNFNDNSGFGTIQGPNQIYEGGWRKYVPHGQGHFMDLDYNCRGQFLAGKFSGQILLTAHGKDIVRKWQLSAYQRSIDKEYTPIKLEQLYEGHLNAYQFIGKEYTNHGTLIEGTWSRQISEQSAKRIQGQNRFEVQFKNGRKNGITSLKHDNGSQITMTYVNGIKHGKFTVANQQRIMKGEYKNGELCDFELIESSIERFQGAWRSIRTGKGIITTPNYTYEGELKDGMYQKGVLNAKGHRIEICKEIGQTCEIIKAVCNGITLYYNMTIDKLQQLMGLNEGANIITGKGKLINRKKGYIYEGELLNCLKHGFGVKLFLLNYEEMDNFIVNKIKLDDVPFKSKQEGYWINGMMSGQVSFFSELYNFEGEFLNGKPHGLGTLTHVPTQQKFKICFEKLIEGQLIIDSMQDNPALKAALMYYNIVKQVHNRNSNTMKYVQYSHGIFKFQKNSYYSFMRHGNNLTYQQFLHICMMILYYMFIVVLQCIMNKILGLQLKIIIQCAKSSFRIVYCHQLISKQRTLQEQSGFNQFILKQLKTEKNFDFL